MAENKKTINEDTTINVSLKSGITIILVILGLFWGFYSQIVVPELDGIKVQNELHYKELLQIKSSIGILEGNMEGIKEGLGDLKTERQSGSAGNAGGI
ncbi:MAG: hypothetical protein ACOCVF_01595 [bacterium]